jgi:integrase
MPTLSFAEAASQYLQTLELENGCNLIRKKVDLERILVPAFGHLPLDQIKRPEIELFKRQMIEKDYQPATVNRYLAILSHLFNKAVEWEWLDKKPAKVVKYRAENIRTVYLSPTEINALIHAASKDTCPVLEPFVRIALGTAMRRYEILSIKIEDINLVHQEIFIPKAKTGARMQPMTPSLTQYLKAYLKEKTAPGQLYLFPSDTAASGHREEIEKSFRRAVVAAGLDVKKVCRHTLRHTAITHLVQAGVDLPTVQRFSGHRSIQMVFRYSHQSKDHINWALSQLESRLEPIPHSDLETIPNDHPT